MNASRQMRWGSTLAGMMLLLASSAVVADGHGLYVRIGAQDGIAAVVDGFLGKVGADDRVNGRFANTGMPKLRGLLIDQVCEATGGPCTYGGMNMLDAHKGMNITEDEFGIIAAYFAAMMPNSSSVMFIPLWASSMFMPPYVQGPPVASHTWSISRPRSLGMPVFANRPLTRSSAPTFPRNPSTTAAIPSCAPIRT